VHFSSSVCGRQHLSFGEHPRHAGSAIRRVMLLDVNDDPPAGSDGINWSVPLGGPADWQPQYTGDIDSQGSTLNDRLYA